jgi:hypothetical protein
MRAAGRGYGGERGVGGGCGGEGEGGVGGGCGGETAWEAAARGKP